jgi:membrane protease YdiL (CAAX protease family)
MSRAAVARGPAVKEQGSPARSKSAPQAVAPEPKGYWQRSETPLTSLAFVLPLIVVYQVGTQWAAQNPIVAFTKLQQASSLVHDMVLALAERFSNGPAHHHPPLTVMYIPATIVIATLLVLHLFRKYPWRVRAADVLNMAIESVVLAVPLLVMWFALAPYLAKLPLMAGPESVVSVAVPCIGAGIYEELLFRLLFFSLMSFLLGDVLKMSKPWMYGFTICLSAVGFSAYHYLGYEQFSPITFVFRSIAGMYFSAVYLCRGYGVTCGSHASYDIIVVCMQHFH